MIKLFKLAANHVKANQQHLLHAAHHYTCCEVVDCITVQFDKRGMAKTLSCELKVLAKEFCELKGWPYTTNFINNQVNYEVGLAATKDTLRRLKREQYRNEWLDFIINYKG